MTNERKWTALYPDARLWLLRLEDSCVLVEQIQQFSKTCEILVGFSAELIEGRDSELLKFDQDHIEVNGLKFDNLGYNVRVDGYIGRLVNDSR